MDERTLRRYQDEGVNLWDDSEIEAKKASAPIGSEEIKELKAEKLRADTRHKQAQAERAELLLLETKGELVRVAEVAEANFAIASQVKCQLLRLEAELPPKLEGLTGTAMARLIREQVEAILGELAANLRTG